jgi:flagellar hook-basal body complex protein FliE
MTISAIASAGAGGMDISQLAELYRQQITDGFGDGGTTAATSASSQAAASRSADFAQMVGDGLQKLEGLDKTASTKAVQAATGDLTDVHDYVIAATQAQVATELTTTLRNKALESFNEIMRMPL